jgi:hypothetical protein
MAVTNRSLAGGSLAAAAAFGAYPSPITYFGYLSGNSASFAGGDPVINTSGALAEAGLAADGATMYGILAPLSPRRQDQVPLTSATAPAAAVPGQKTTPAAGTPDYANVADPNFAVAFYPFIPGNVFAGHLTDEDGNGTDVRAQASVDIYRQTGYSNTLTAGAAGDQINYATKAGLWVLCFDMSAQVAETRVLAYVNPQPTSVAGGVFVDAPGNIVQNGGATGTFNPMVIWVPTISALWP